MVPVISCYTYTLSVNNCWLFSFFFWWSTGNRLLGLIVASSVVHPCNNLSGWCFWNVMDKSKFCEDSQKKYFLVKMASYYLCVRSILFYNLADMYLLLFWCRYWRKMWIGKTFGGHRLAFGWQGRNMLLLESIFSPRTSDQYVCLVFLNLITVSFKICVSLCIMVIDKPSLRRDFV